MLTHLWLPADADVFDAARARLTPGGRWLVPEPYSHAAERALATTQTFDAEVVTFERICDRVLGSGGNRPVFLTEGGRLLTCLQAIRRTATALGATAALVGKPEFPALLLQAIDECKSYGITADDLERTNDPRLADIALLLRSYEAHCDLPDSRDKWIFAAEALHTDVTPVTTLCVSCFASFTPAERILLKALARNADQTLLFWSGKPDPMLYPALCREARLLEQQLGAPDETIVVPASPSMVETQSLLADSPAEECRLAAALVQTLTRDQGVRYRDILVVTANPEVYLPLLLSIFPQADVPLFQDDLRTFTASPLARLCRALLETTKFGLTGRLLVEIARFAAPQHADKLALYIERWNPAFVSRPFVRSPRGFVDCNAQDSAVLDELNAVRETVTHAVRRLGGGITAREQAKRLWETLHFLHAVERLETRRQVLSGFGEARLAAETAQHWDTFCDALEETAAVLGEEVLSMTDFLAFFLVLLESATVGVIPPTLDRVVVGDLHRTARVKAEVVICLGLSDLPSDFGGGGLIGSTERTALTAMGCETSPDAQSRAEREMYDLETVLALAKTKRFLLFSRKDGKVPRVMAIDNWGGWGKFDGRMDSARLETEMSSNCQLSPPTASAIFGKNGAFLLSASRVQCWYQCPMLFFCRYGLRLREHCPTPTLPANAAGSLTHAVLETLLQTDYPSADAMASAAAAETLRQGAMWGDDPRVRAQIERIAAENERIAADLFEEQTRAQFRPTGFEVTLPPRVFPLDGAPMEQAVLSGKIDRVDVFTRNGKQYLRVADYKSGKSLDLRGMEDGTLIQLPLYLFALCEAENALPAGAVFVSVREERPAFDHPPTEAEMVSAQQKHRRRAGLFLHDTGVLAAMDTRYREADSFLSIGTSGKPAAGSALFSPEEMAQCKADVFQKVTDMATAAANGAIAPSPQGDVCKFCMVREVCELPMDS